VLSSEAPGETTVMPAEPGMREWRLERVGTARLPKTAGMHRFVWDLRYPGPWSSDAVRAGRGGPMAPPGKYQARLSAGSFSSAVSFEAKLDPRVIREGVTPADVIAQAELALKARDALSGARAAAARIQKARKEKAAQAADKKVDEIFEQLVTAPIRYSRPMIIDQLEYLYQNLNRADQRPGKDAYSRYEELNTALQGHLQSLRQVLGEKTDAEGAKR